MIRAVFKLALLAVLLMATGGCCTTYEINEIQEAHGVYRMTMPDLAYVGTDGSIALRAHVIDVSNRASAHNGKVRYLLFDREAVKLAAGTRYPSLLLGTAAAVLIPGNLTGPDGTEAMLPAPTRNGTSYRLTEEKEQGDGWYPSDTHLSSFPYAIDSRSYAVRVEDTGEWRYYTSGNRVHIVGCSLLLPPAVAIDATFFPFEYLAARMLAHPDH